MELAALSPGALGFVLECPRKPRAFGLPVPTTLARPSKHATPARGKHECFDLGALGLVLEPSALSPGTLGFVLECPRPGAFSLLFCARVEG